MFAFEQLFDRPDTLVRHRTGPMAEDRARFLAYLADQGMSCTTLQHIAPYLMVIAGRLRLADRLGEIITRDEIKREAVRWAGRKPRLHDQRNALYSRKMFVSYGCRWLKFLGRLGPPAAVPCPHAVQIKAFAHYMLHEKGLSPATIDGRCRRLGRLLNRLGSINCSLREITIAQIDEAFIGMINHKGYSRVSVQKWASELRIFLRFAEVRGWCKKGLADAIRAPHVFGQALLPAGPAWDNVQRLLAMTKGSQPADIRDRAILMLLAVYGLRAHEVRLLRLENIDWERELLTVPSRKAQPTRTYPLSRPVGEAILRYLKEVRPRTTHREVFMCLRPPIRPLGHMWAIVGTRLRSLNVTLPHYGPHALRHSCATHLLSQGLSLKEIGDHLRHRSLESTRIYAKVDIVGLREVADFELGGLV